MSILIAFIIIVVVLALVAKLYSILKDKLNFLFTGLDSGFTIPELVLLWNVSQICNLSDPNALFWSLPALTKCMTELKLKTQSDNGQKYEGILTKLFAYRTKVQNEHDQKKGLQTSQDLDRGQKLRIILPGSGVFSSEIVNNGGNMTISIPKQNNMIPVPAQDWVNKTIKIYLWRNSDASYVFDTTVIGQGIFLGKLCLYLKQSTNLLRTQKRQSVRAKCEIPAILFFVPDDNIDYSAIETSGGYKCLLEDISESGALIRIGGRGHPNTKLKIQFNINNKLIIMLGTVRNVEFNAEINQSRLHFECIHIDEHMKNEILSFVYNTLPQEEREILDALALTDSDEQADKAEEQALNMYSQTHSDEGEGSIKKAQEITSGGESPSENETIPEDNVSTNGDIKVLEEMEPLSE